MAAGKGAGAGMELGSALSEKRRNLSETGKLSPAVA